MWFFSNWEVYFPYSRAYFGTNISLVIKKKRAGGSVLFYLDAVPVMPVKVGFPYDSL